MEKTNNSISLDSGKDGSTPVSMKRWTLMLSSFVDGDYDLRHHMIELERLAVLHLTPKSFAQRMTAIHPLTPLKSILVKREKKHGKFCPVVILTIGSPPKPFSEIADLVRTISSIYTRIYTERLVCGSCFSSVRIGEPACLCGCKRLLPMPDNYSAFAPISMVNKVKRDKLKRAPDEIASLISGRISLSPFEESSISMSIINESMMDLTLNLNGQAPRHSRKLKREAAVENEFINYMNSVPIATILRQRVRGHRTRPLSLSASDVKSTFNLKDLITANADSRVMSADTKQLSPIYDLLIDEMGKDDKFPRWKCARSKGALFDFGEFGSVKIKGCPDAIFDDVPVELKTCKGSLHEGAYRDKISTWMKQVATYQMTHGVEEGKAGHVILLVVSLKDLEVFAVDIHPIYFHRARRDWIANLETVFGGKTNRYRQYWDKLVEFRNHDEAWRAKRFAGTMRDFHLWQAEHAARELSEGMELIPRIFEAGIASEFERKVSLGRKLILRGRKSWAAKAEDRTARRLLNGLNKDLSHLFENGNMLATAAWTNLKKKVESREADLVVARQEGLIVVGILNLMGTVARWREKKNEISAVEKALVEVRATMQAWKKAIRRLGKVEAEVFEAVGTDQGESVDDGDVDDNQNDEINDDSDDNISDYIYQSDDDDVDHEYEYG